MFQNMLENIGLLEYDGGDENGYSAVMARRKKRFLLRW